MTDVSEIAERLRAVLNDGLSSVAICNKNDLRAILSLMSERDEANARALNWECRFETASARGAAAEARIRELSLSELTALGQAHENHKRALDAEARLGRAAEALRAAKGAIDAAEIVGARNAAGYLTDRALWAQCAIDRINHALSDLEVKDDNG